MIKTEFDYMVKLEYQTLVRYLSDQNSECSVDDLRMGLLKEASVEKYEIKNTDEILDKYGELVLKKVSEDPQYYYGFIDKLRKPKFFGMAIFDIAMTIVGILFLAVLIGKSFMVTSVGVFLFAVLTHWYFGIETQLGYYIGLNQQMRSIFH